jgi:hypothetical protein
LKEYWLCRNCEQTIGDWERQFASKIFHPITKKGSHRIAYSRWLLRFCVSISWRALLRAKEKNFADFTDVDRHAASSALNMWREFMWDRAAHPGPFEQHLLIFEDVASYGPGSLPANMNRYALRSIEVDIASADQFGFTFVKMGPFAVLGFFRLSRPREWKGGKVHLNQGHVDVAKYMLPIQFRDYLVRRARKAAAVMGGLSAEQRAVADRANEAVAKDKLVDSHWMKAMQRDFEQFGDEAFKEGWPGDGDKK